MTPRALLLAFLSFVFSASVFAAETPVVLPLDVMVEKTIPSKSIFSVEIGFPMHPSGELAQFNTTYAFKIGIAG